MYGDSILENSLQWFEEKNNSGEVLVKPHSAWTTRILIKYIDCVSIQLIYHWLTICKWFLRHFSTYSLNSLATIRLFFFYIFQLLSASLVHLIIRINKHFPISSCLHLTVNTSVIQKFMHILHNKNVLYIFFPNDIVVCSVCLLCMRPQQRGNININHRLGYIVLYYLTCVQHWRQITIGSTRSLNELS